jgi:hypothetical protein
MMRSVDSQVVDVLCFACSFVDCCCSLGCVPTFFYRAHQGFLAKLQRIRLLIWQQWMLFYETKMVIFPQFALDEPTKDGNKYKFHEPTVK